MTAGALLLGLAAFVILLQRSFAPEAGLEALSTMRHAVATMADATLTDDDKERLLRRASLLLFRDFLLITLSGLLALSAPVAIVWAGAAVGLFTFHDVANAAMSWPFLLGSSIGSILIWLAAKRLT